MAIWLLVLAQVVLAARVFARMARTLGGERIGRVRTAPAGLRAVAVVPVLDEERRLGPCLAGLAAQGPELAAIVVVDGGSRDGTVALARRRAATDPRIRVVSAGPAPHGANGKVHNLVRGVEEAAAVPGANWLLSVDADVRPAPGLVAALLAHAVGRDLAALSAATAQRLSGPAEALIHPSLLATLVYRFGVPGHATADPALVQANGQCMLVRRDLLARVGGFAPLAHAVAEDVALARRLAALGEPVGFFETDDLVAVEMYAGAREALVNWSRSLPLTEGASRRRALLGLAEVVLVQAAPLVIVAGALARRAWARRFADARRGRAWPAPSPAADDDPAGAAGSLLYGLNLALLAARFGALAGMARAYPRRPAAYWLSPATDGVAAAALLLRAARTRHAWRGRVIERKREPETGRTR